MIAILALALAAPDPDPVALVRRLGDQSFAIREEAEAALLGLGLAAKPALETGLTDRDLEIRARCERLLAKVRTAEREGRIQAFLDAPAVTLPGWKRYQAIVQQADRKRFVAIYRAEADLLERPTELAVRIRDLPLGVLLSDRESAILAGLPAWLLLAGDPEIQVEPAVLTELLTGLELLARRESIRKDFLAIPGHAELLMAVCQRGGAAGLPLMADLKLPAGKAHALALALRAAEPAILRASAILVVARLGTRDDVAPLRPLLNDTTAVGMATVGGTRLNAELGDVALAAMLQLQGEKLEDYGFPHARVVPGLKALPAPERLGFIDAAGRKTARERWEKKFGVVNP